MTTPGSNGPDQQPGGGASGWGQPPAGQPGGYSPPPPPPPGGFPQGQYQPQPGGAPHPPQGAPYPPQGGAPYQPQPGFGAPQKSGLPKWLIPVIAGVVLVAGALALFAFFGGGNTAEVGDCVAQTGVDEVELVDCDDDSAVGQVIGFDDEGISYDEYRSRPGEEDCEDFPDVVGTYWEGEEGEEGKVVCVGAV